MASSKDTRDDGRGPWLRADGLYACCKSCGPGGSCSVNAPTKLLVPTADFWNASAAREVVRKEARLPVSEPSTPTGEQEQLRAGVGSNVPVEIMAMIWGYLLEEAVPTGTAYHFLAGRRNNVPVQVVQQMVPRHQQPNEPDSSGRSVLQANAKRSSPARTADIVRYALVSRAWNAAVYKRFYGANSFHFNVCAATAECRVSSRDFRLFESWTRTVPGACAPSSRPLGPLTARAARWLQDVTLVVAAPVSQTTKELDQLERLVQSTVEMLGKGGSMLIKLRVHLMAADRADRRYDTMAINVLDADVDAGSGRMKVGFRGEPTIEAPRRSKLERVLEPLLEIKGINDLAVSGRMSELFADKLTEAVKLQKEHGSRRD